mmetsp:Transcript_28604/g.47340  ORF Transcript_28604/g.47340 Transcript_28604/m.47340 type:complete len:302 (-) Transcript_28604:251-1156(-)
MEEEATTMAHHKTSSLVVVAAVAVAISKEDHPLDRADTVVLHLTNSNSRELVDTRTTGDLKVKSFPPPKCTWVALLGKGEPLSMICRSVPVVISKLTRMLLRARTASSPSRERDRVLNTRSRCCERSLRWGQIIPMLEEEDNTSSRGTSNKEVTSSPQTTTCSRLRCTAGISSSNNKDNKCMAIINSSNRTVASTMHLHNSMLHRCSSNNSTECHHTSNPGDTRHKLRRATGSNSFLLWLHLCRCGSLRLLLTARSTITTKRLGRLSGTNLQECRKKCMHSFHCLAHFVCRSILCCVNVWL